MLKVNFYNKNEIDDSKYMYAVICAKYRDQWIYCKHRERDTYEIPGGRREENENILDCAKRELYEETGSIQFDIEEICAFGVLREEESYGMLYYANVHEIGDMPQMEIEKIEFFDEMPTKLTYPLIQPFLLEKVLEKRANS